ncbi:MAG: Fur family transcriptional regulator [Chthoniobacterales bacterium]
MTLSNKLREMDIPITAQRLAVMRTVESHPHTTADKIIDLVSKDIGTISRQAVYNVLALLEQKGLVRKIQPAGSAARYETLVEDNHQHLICRRCGKMVDVNCSAKKLPTVQTADRAGFLIDRAELIYWGICPACQKS